MNFKNVGDRGKIRSKSIYSQNTGFPNRLRHFRLIPYFYVILSYFNKFLINHLLSSFYYLRSHSIFHFNQNVTIIIIFFIDLNFNIVPNF